VRPAAHPHPSPGSAAAPDNRSLSFFIFKDYFPIFFTSKTDFPSSMSYLT
jgi:hypothetical protein